MSTLKENIELIQNYIANNYKNNFREPLGKIKHPFIVPGSCYSHQLWDWDSWLTGVALMDIDDENMFSYQTGCVINFIEHMDKIGRMPILIQEPGEFEVFNLVDGVETNCHKPCIAQHALEICKHYKNIEWIREYYPSLEKFINYYKTYCRHNETGLYFWINDLGIGFDNDPTVFYHQYKSVGALYLNCLMYEELKAMAELANLLCYKDKEELYSHMALELKNAIEEECYDKIDGCYYSADISLRPVDKNEWLHSGYPRTWKSLPIKVLTWATFMPLWNGIATKEEAESVVGKYYMNYETLNSEYGVRSVSKKEKMYAVVPSGNPSCWLGPIWIVVNYMTYIGLKNYGYDELAKELAIKTINLLGNDLKENGQFTEYYSPETGKGVHNPGFQSWNFLVLKMIKDLND